MLKPQQNLTKLVVLEKKNKGMLSIDKCSNGLKTDFSLFNISLRELQVTMYCIIK